MMGLLFLWGYFCAEIVVGVFAAFWEDLPWGEVYIVHYYIAIVL